MKTSIVIDLETTGFSRKVNDIIEIGATEVTPDFKIGRKFKAQLRPSNPKTWNKKAQEVHKISLRKAMKFEPRRQGLIEFLIWLKPFMHEFPVNFIYHGRAGFDYKFLKEKYMAEGLLDSFLKAFSENHVYSTEALAKEVLTDLPDYKLGTVCKALKIKMESYHEALSDSVNSAEIFCEIKSNYNQYKGILL